jgi:integrase
VIDRRVVFRARTTTKRTREVKVPKKLQSLLKKSQLPQSGYLFPGRRDGHLAGQAVEMSLCF